MWCSSCQQDVPALGSASGGDLRCGKCGTRLASAAAVVADQAESPPPVEPTALTTPSDNPAPENVLRKLPLPEDDWALEAEVRDVQRLLTSLKSRPALGSEALSFHVGHVPAAGRHSVSPEPLVGAADLSDIESTDRDDADVADNRPPRGHAATWSILSLSLAVFTCGAVLLVWSIVGQRQDLWPVGLPLTLIGQAGLIVGVVLQVDGLIGRHASTPRRAEYRRPRSRRRPRRVTA